MNHIYSGPQPRRLRNWKRINEENLTRGERVIAFIESYLKVPEGQYVGKLMKLEKFQKQFIIAVYDNKSVTRRALLSIARKNGKSALIAALLIAHIIGPEAKQNSQIVSGAMSRDQAALVFALAAKMLRMSELMDFVRIVDSQKRIVGLVQNVEYRALAADSKTAHGLSPVLAILDEIGQVRGPVSEFVDAITTSQGAHEAPILMVISTQASSDGDLLSVWLDDAQTNQPQSTVCHLYTADADCELSDKTAWKLANPALGSFRSMADVEEQAQQAQRMPSAANTFRNLILNQRVDRHSPFISREVWKQCGGEVDYSRFGENPIYGGLDLSARTDLTSLVLVSQIDDVWHVIPFFWTPEATLIERSKKDRQPYDVWAREGYLRTTPGASIDYGYVAKELAEIARQYILFQNAYDRWRMDVLQKELEAIGLDLPLMPFGQGFKDMSPALDEVEAALLNGQMRHGMHPVLTMCAANAVVTRDPANNRKLDKHRATGRIDGLVALTMAMGAATSSREISTEPAVYFF